MSEPSSLYVCVTLTQKSFAAFCQSQPVAPHFYKDWQGWLATKKFYGAITDEQIAALSAAPVTSLGDYLTSLVQDIYAGPAQSVYDPAANRWTLVVAQLSENFIDFIEALTPLRRVAQYKDLPGEDFILIYPHFWGGEPEAYLVVTEGNSAFVHNAPAEAIDEASQALQRLYQEFVGSGDKDL